LSEPDRELSVSQAHVLLPALPQNATRMNFMGFCELLELAAPDLPPLGSTDLPTAEPVRFRSRAQLGLPGKEIYAVEFDYDDAAKPPAVRRPHHVPRDVGSTPVCRPIPAAKSRRIATAPYHYRDSWIRLARPGHAITGIAVKDRPRRPGYQTLRLVGTDLQDGVTNEVADWAEPTHVCGS
jgi:hypothetical protein